VFNFCLWVADFCTPTLADKKIQMQPKLKIQMQSDGIMQCQYIYICIACEGSFVGLCESESRLFCDSSRLFLGLNISFYFIMITFFEKFLSRKTINTWLPLSICGTCCCLDSPLSGLICHIRPSSLYGSKSKSEKAKESWKADGSTKPDSRLDKLDKCRLKWSATWLIASVFLSLCFFFSYF